MYGKKIHDKIVDLLNPQFEDDPSINAFDLWDGAFFKLRIATVDGYRNYDKSSFDLPTRPLSENDDILQKIWESEHSLKEFVDPSNFKSFDTLKMKFDRVNGTASLTEISSNVAMDHTTSYLDTESTDPTYDTDSTDDILKEYEKLKNS